MRLQDVVALFEGQPGFKHDVEVGLDDLREWAAENARLRALIDWVESWVSNPVGSYSVSALDGLFAMTRDKIRALEQARKE